jgi:hypothetical protein
MSNANYASVFCKQAGMMDALSSLKPSAGAGNVEELLRKLEGKTEGKAREFLLGLANPSKAGQNVAVGATAGGVSNALIQALLAEIAPADRNGDGKVDSTGGAALRGGLQGAAVGGAAGLAAPSIQRLLDGNDTQRVLDAISARASDPSSLQQKTATQAPGPGVITKRRRNAMVVLGAVMGALGGAGTSPMRMNSMGGGSVSGSQALARAAVGAGIGGAAGYGLAKGKEYLGMDPLLPTMAVEQHG